MDVRVGLWRRLSAENWCVWTVVLKKTPESPLDCKEIQPVHSEGNQPWDFFGRMMLKLKLQYFGWHHSLDGCKSEWTPGDSDGQGGLACWDSWGCKESDSTERLNWTELRAHHRFYNLQEAHSTVSTGVCVWRSNSEALQWSWGRERLNVNVINVCPFWAFISIMTFFFFLDHFQYADSFHLWKKGNKLAIN